MSTYDVIDLINRYTDLGETLALGTFGKRYLEGVRFI
jgi:hypothetical protein